MRAKYWCNSKLADFIRGTDKIKVGTMVEWRRWELEAKQKHPWRYYIAENVLSMLQDIIHIPDDFFNNVTYYISNRWIYKSHALVADKKHIAAGEYQDFGYRLLPCTMKGLVDFVEIDLAWAYCRWDIERLRRYNGSFLKKRFGLWRSPEAGLEFLNVTISNPHDHGEDWVNTFKDVLEVYNWWKNIYPNRPDPYEVTGFSGYLKNKYDTDDIDDEEDDTEVSKSIIEAHRSLEVQYAQEETDMIIKIVKVREFLWS